jgi:predicted nucleic acid-binding protein
MTDFVLDASVALAWCFSDEATPATANLLDRLEADTAHVPAIWPLEVGNILVIAERKKRIHYADISRLLQLFNEINILIDEQTAARGFHEIISLAHAESITTYDAAYLELAMRLGVPLATKDNQLVKAAKKIGVKIIEI